jgi:hypothetical protein
MKISLTSGECSRIRHRDTASVAASVYQMLPSPMTDSRVTVSNRSSHSFHRRS